MAPTFNAIGLSVADMATTLAFYRALGLDVPAEADTEQHAEVKLSSGMRLMWDTHDLLRSIDPDFTPAREPAASLAFECADATEVDATWAAMTAAGHHGHRAPWNAVWGQRYAVLHDPDGASVELYAWLKTV